jgi:hypothetical protein
MVPADPVSVCRRIRGVILLTDSREPPGAWAGLRLWRLDTRATARLTLSLSQSPGCWLLEQAGRPVGVIERAPRGDRLWTISHEWRAKVCRAGRLGWQLEFRRVDEAQPALRYRPHTMRPGGRLAFAGGHRYRLRCPLLREDWSIAASPAGQLGRIAFRPRGRVTDYMKYVRFGDQAIDEVLLSVVMLAASAAILVHADEPKLPGGPWP